MKAELTDLPGILSLQYLAYQSEATLHNDPNIPPLKQTLDEVQCEFENGLILKAVDKSGTIIGSVRGYAEDGTFFIGKLIVRPDLQGQGIGTLLMHEIERLSQVNRYELFTSTKSVRNIKLYKRLGYQIFKEEPQAGDLKFVYMEKTAE